jgi:hypothetical protein
MTRAGLGKDEVKKVRFWRLMLTEMLGTLIIVLLGSLVQSRALQRHSYNEVYAP